ncbi:plasmid mobilization relaxosome protein MobC [Ralstonia solanacearum]|nr:plasmid mobilization relaxosome protein MobC [Ralstonia solanacearum]QKM33766.1 plasmid mobilization relaxosome protein MobC [Ralstonia solanacearum]QKM38753.1 plasmid mobilization relaxosome protein MobC [Ralstonia solanacearum]
MVFKFEREKTYTEKLQLYVSKEQRQKLNQDRKNLGLNSSELIRLLLSKEFPYVEQLNKLVYQVNRYSNNLNQIAYRCNLKKDIDDEDLEDIRDIKKGLYLLIDEVKKLR